MFRGRMLGIVALIVGSSGLCSVVHAETEKDLDTAKALFEDGRRLMTQGKYDAADQLRRPRLDPPDRGVAIFYRKRKIAGHEWRAHSLVLARGDAAGQDKAFGATADGAEQRTYTHLIEPKRTEHFLADFGASRPGIPKRLGDIVCPAGCHFLTLGWTNGTPQRVIYPAPIVQISEVKAACWNAPHRI